MCWPCYWPFNGQDALLLIYYELVLLKLLSIELCSHKKGFAANIVLNLYQSWKLEANIHFAIGGVNSQFFTTNMVHVYMGSLVHFIIV